MTGPNLSTTRTTGNSVAEHVADHNTLAQVANLLDLTVPPIFTSNRPVALMDQTGIDWTGAADSSTGVQSVITAAGAGTKIELGRGGSLRLDSPLTLLNFQTLEGPTFNLGAGGTSTVQLSFANLTGSQSGIVGADSNTIRNLLLRGPGPTVGTTTGIKTTSGSPRLDKVQMFNWWGGLSMTNAFYAVLEQCEWQYCQSGVILSNCYNVNVYSPHFNCANSATPTVYYTAFEGAARDLSIYGGAIENYGAVGAIRPASIQAVNAFGTYFESSRSGSAAWGILGGSKDKLSILLQGCRIYLTEHSRFVDLSSSTNSSLVARGNRFVCPGTSSTTPIAYVFGSSPTADVQLDGDVWNEMAIGSYTDNATALGNGGLAGMDIRHPAPYTTYGTREFVGRDLYVSTGKIALANIPILTGTGSPASVVSAPVGSMYLRSDGGTGTTLYVKESGTGNTGWVAK